MTYLVQLCSRFKFYCYRAFSRARIDQSNNAISIGHEAGKTAQGLNSIAIGHLAGIIDQSANSIAIGYEAGKTRQLNQAIAIGRNAGEDSQGQNAIAIGRQAGQINQTEYGVAIGWQAGFDSQGDSAVALGEQSGRFRQRDHTIAIGYQAGQTDQKSFAIAMGWTAGRIDQSNNAIAIGYEAGKTSQGANSIAIGNEAGKTNQHSTSIVINAETSALNTAGSGRCYVNPIRSEITTDVLYYNNTSKEITRGAQVVDTRADNFTFGLTFDLTLATGGANPNTSRFWLYPGSGYIKDPHFSSSVTNYYSYFSGPRAPPSMAIAYDSARLSGYAIHITQPRFPGNGWAGYPNCSVGVQVFCDIDASGIPQGGGVTILLDTERTCQCGPIREELEVGCGPRRFLGVYLDLDNSRPIPANFLRNGYNISVTLYTGEKLNPPA